MDKVTNETDGCLSVTVSILGDKWSPLLIHALAGGPLRFCELQTTVGGVNPRTLSGRLSSLELYGILTKKVFAEIPPHTEYTLTPKGRDLLPILDSMKAWSAKYPPPQTCDSEPILKAEATVHAAREEMFATVAEVDSITELKATVPGGVI